MSIKKIVTSFAVFVLILLSIIPLSCKKTGDDKDTNVTTGPIELEVKQENRYALTKTQSKMFVEMDLLPVKNIGGKKLPLNLSIVIDRSGSMLEEGKLEYVKEAVSYFVDKLGDDDTLSIVTYSDNVQVLVEQNPILSDETIKEKLTRVHGGGWTNLSGGLEEGFRQVISRSDEGEINRILLLSDGLANRGITDISGLSELAGDIVKKDISITTIGVGADYDEDILRAISEEAVGNYYYIAKPTEIPDIYEGELVSLFNTVATDAKLSIRLTNGARLGNIFGYDYETVGNNIHTVELGSLTAGVDRWVVMELFVPYSEEKGEVNFGTVWLGYEDITEGAGEEIEYSEDISIEYTDDRDDLEKGRDIEVVNVAMYIIAQQAKKDAQRYLREGDLFAASDILKQQNLYIESKYDETGAVIPGSVMSEMEQNKDDADLIYGGAGGGVLSEETLSTKSKELDYENYEKTRKKVEID